MFGRELGKSGVPGGVESGVTASFEVVRTAWGYLTQEERKAVLGVVRRAMERVKTPH